ncbi:hypothetical protein [Nocardia wallacei]|uniref:hypothetical protein n=1 Tax=Nocardia wallacei TaxID=480035 RepID=UPI002458CBA4|nr:hypothetical protein [Nocardia wallacei]
MRTTQTLQPGTRVRIADCDDDGPHQVTMTVTDPPNDTGHIGVGFGYDGVRLMWVTPRQILHTL